MLLHNKKRQEGGFLGMLLGNLVALMLGNMLTGKYVLRAGKVVVRTGGGYKNIDHMDKNFYFCSIL